MELDFLYLKNNVGYLTEKQCEFSNLYTAVRKKENRILTDEMVKQLPQTALNNTHAKEWRLRVKSTQRFTKYINSRTDALSILDIGCGNGWFTNTMAAVNKKNKIIGVDINTQELEQAARIFNTKNLQFVYADIFKTKVFHSKFDMITLNACVQYFPDFKLLFKTLKSFLKVNGEIHIIDSPFYKGTEIKEAKSSTLMYYSHLGFPEMASHYFHHSEKNIKDFKILYKPNRMLFSKLINRKDSPFFWLYYINN